MEVKMKRNIVFFIIFSLFGIITAIKDQNADDIAKALADRLTCPHIHADVLEQGSAYFRIGKKWLWISPFNLEGE